MSKELLKLLSAKENFAKYSRYVKPHIFANQEMKAVFNDMAYWFTNDLNPEIDWSNFGTWFKSKNKIKEDSAGLYDRLFLQLNTMKTPDDPVHKEIVHAFIIKDTGRRIGEVGLKAHDGDIDNLDEVYDILEQYDKETSGIVDASEHEVGHDLTEIMGTVDVGGLDWPYTFLNQACGPVRVGDFIIIASRPDGGKTSLLCNLANCFGKQLPMGKTVVIFNNEGSGSKYRLRLIQTGIGQTYFQIRKDPQLAQQRYEALIGSPQKIIIVDNARITTDLVERKLKQHDAGVVIFDQLYKVHGFTKAKDDLSRQAQIFAWARELAKQHGPTFTVHQADASAEGIEYIGMSQLYGSKTSVQGEADAIITIGQSRDPAKQSSRFLYVPKNKLIGGPQSVAALRHGKAELTLEPDTGRFIE